MIRSWLSRTARKRIQLTPPRIDGLLVEDGPGYEYYRGPQTRRLANEAQAIRQNIQQLQQRLRQVRRQAAREEVSREKTGDEEEEEE